MKFRRLMVCSKFAKTKETEMIELNCKQLTRIYPVSSSRRSSQPVCRVPAPVCLYLAARDAFTIALRAYLY